MPATASRTAAEIPAIHDLDPSHRHHRDTTAGYLVVVTDWTAGMANLTREPVGYFAIEVAFRAGEASYTHAYGEALDAVHEARRACGPCQYAIIDVVYDCGCRAFG
jgi:hypothetical protein